LTDLVAVAKKAWVLVQQVTKFRSDIMGVREGAERLGPGPANSAVSNYNFILEQARIILELDPDFSDLIADLAAAPTVPQSNWLGTQVRTAYERMIYESGRLESALTTFVQYHLSPEEKRKIGF